MSSLVRCIMEVLLVYTFPFFFLCERKVEVGERSNVIILQQHIKAKSSAPFGIQSDLWDRVPPHAGRPVFVRAGAPRPRRPAESSAPSTASHGLTALRLAHRVIWSRCEPYSASFSLCLTTGSYCVAPLQSGSFMFFPPRGALVCYWSRPPSDNELVSGQIAT